MAVLELADSARFNTMSWGLGDDMHRAVNFLRAQPALRAVCWQAAGRVFCAGASPHTPGAPTSLAGLARFIFDYKVLGFVELANLPVPVVCAAHGALVGGGVAMFLQADVRLAESEASFQHGNLSRGVCPVAGFSRSLKAIVGTEQALAFYLMDQPISATAAMSLGLVHEVCAGVTSTKRRAEQLCHLLLTRGRALDLVASRLATDVELLAREVVLHTECLLVNGGLQLARAVDSGRVVDDISSTVEAKLMQVPAPLRSRAAATTRDHVDFCMAPSPPASTCWDASPALVTLDTALRGARQPVVALCPRSDGVQRWTETRRLGLIRVEGEAAELAMEALRLQRNRTAPASSPSKAASTARPASARGQAPIQAAIVEQSGVVVLTLPRVAINVESMLASIAWVGAALRAVVLHLGNETAASPLDGMRPSARDILRVQDAMAALHSLGVPIVCSADTELDGLAKIVWEAADFRIGSPHKNALQAQRQGLLTQVQPAGKSTMHAAVERATWLAQHSAIGLKCMLGLTRDPPSPTRSMASERYLTASERYLMAFPTGSGPESKLLLGMLSACAESRAPRRPRKLSTSPSVVPAILRSLRPSKPSAPADKTARFGGVRAVEVYVPRHCVRAAGWASASSASLEGSTFGSLEGLMECYSGCGEDEDVVSMALTALYRLMRTQNLSPEQIGYLCVGSQTPRDRSKGIKSELMALLECGGQASVEGVDVYTYPGQEMAALQGCFHWIQGAHWDGRFAVAVCSDQTGPGGAMACAVLVGPALHAPSESSLPRMHAPSESSLPRLELPWELPCAQWGPLPEARLERELASQLTLIVRVGPRVGAARVASAAQRIDGQLLRALDARTPLSARAYLALCSRGHEGRFGRATRALLGFPRDAFSLREVSAPPRSSALMAQPCEAASHPVRVYAYHGMACLQYVARPPTPPARRLLDRDEDLQAVLNSLLGGSSEPDAVAASTASDAMAAVREAVEELLPGMSADLPFMEAGIDSLGAVELRNRLMARLGDDNLPETIVFDFPTLRQLEQHVQQQQFHARQPAPRESHRSLHSILALLNSVSPTVASHQAQGVLPGVIVSGVSCKLPGSIVSSIALLEVAGTGHDVVRQVPQSRWEAYHLPDWVDEMTGRRTWHGAFMVGAELFDAERFDISAREAQATDPQQRLVLEMSYEALHASGKRKPGLLGSSAGVALGICWNEFVQVLEHSPLGRSVYAATGAALSIASGRVSYALGLHGPCISIETACSASLVACGSALSGVIHENCEMHVAAGVSMMLLQSTSVSMAIAGMTSIKGRCHTFDRRADGFVRGEGCCALLLVARGKQPPEPTNLPIMQRVSVRQDGRSASLTAPNGQAQLGLLQAAHVHGTTAASLSVVETHGTGTPLGDPIEVGSVAALVRSQRADAALTPSGIKANLGHTEATAGMAGLASLLIRLKGQAPPNAQLRGLNPHVAGALRGAKCAFVVQSAAEREQSGGVSSFGYSGTIAHAVLQRSDSGGISHHVTLSTLSYVRRYYGWREQPLSLGLRPVSSSGETHLFRAAVAGPLLSAVADHVVQGRIIFPGSGYLELARAAASVALSKSTAAALRDVVFLQPLGIEASGLHLECKVAGGRFEVCSGEVGDGGMLMDAAVHCSGTMGVSSHDENRGWFDHALARAHVGARAFEVSSLYDRFDAMGLQYGPGFRTLDCAWVGGHGLTSARLQSRSAQPAGHVHPADLDGALSLTSLVSDRGHGEMPRLPFSVDEARLHGASGALWAAVARQGGEAVSVFLSCRDGSSPTRLDGFKSRVLRADALARRDLYIIKWHKLDSSAMRRMDGTDGVIAVLATGTQAWTSRAAAAQTVARGRAVATRRWHAVATLASLQRGQAACSALSALDAAFALLQAQAASEAPLAVWLLTLGAQHASTATRTPSVTHAGSWGLARTARVESLLAVLSVDGQARPALECAASLPEPEAVLINSSAISVPRLTGFAASPDGPVRVHLLSRGAISNLSLERQPLMRAESGSEVKLRVRAVGLNFRDVLNVLGEYPGEPGPPGADVAGIVIDPGVTQLHARHAPVFGMARAPLASYAYADARLIACKPAPLSFEQCCTLPVTWITTHVSLGRASLRSGHGLVVHAAAGGVGLKSLEYAQWLGVSVLGTAGRPQKHAYVRSMGARFLCSSRDASAFAAGSARLLESERCHAVLNSLSGDFISTSFACLTEGGALKEIGKRSIWSTMRHVAAAPCTTFEAIALDAETTRQPWWTQRVLLLLSTRANSGVVASLPLRSFDMRSQYEIAFRFLQGGHHIGKVVLCEPMRGASALEGLSKTQVVTGGTSGLGLLTARWLAGRGAKRVVLASRSGMLARTSDLEWKALQASSATAVLERCDTSDVSHNRRLASVLPSVGGVWHAAGVLADAVLPRQDASSLVRVYAPKAQGAWSLHSAMHTRAVGSFVLFSSVAALLGGAGQANYASANACLDSLSAFRRRHGRASLSVQWGAWAEVGMAARSAASERVAAMWKATAGFGQLSLAQGLAALSTLSEAKSSAVVGVLQVTWSRFVGDGAVVPALLSMLMSPPTTPTNLAPILEMNTPKASRLSSTARAVSLETVLELVKQTAAGAVDADAPLMEAGIDSLGAVELRNQLQAFVGGDVRLSSTLVFDHPTARQLAEVLRPKASESRRPNALTSQADHPPSILAVGGTSVLMPENVTSLSAARCLVTCGHDAIAEVPVGRWDVASASSMPDPIGSRMRYGGFVIGCEFADHRAFSISAAEAAAMDPQQRLLLEHGYAALHDARLDRAKLGGSLSGVFLGISATDFAQVLALSPAGGSVYAATGASLSIAAGRLSYVLGLHGPCVSCDTACSSALVASHAALSALKLKECTVGLVSAVMLMLSPGAGMSFAIAGMTSARGRSHSFDARADGYARGEACSAVALQHVDDCYASVKVHGSAVRQDGRSASLTAPNGQAQRGLLVASCSSAGVSRDWLSLVEAHGTGTELGDPIEAGSLVAAMLQGRRGSAPLAASSIKGNVGHAEAAAGITGMLKLVLGLRAGMAAPNAQLRVLNPHVHACLHGYADGVLPVQATRLLASEMGGVSSFGYSGTIAHAVVGHLVARVSVPPPTYLLYRRVAFAWQQRSVAPSNASQVLSQRFPSGADLYDHLISLVRAMSWSDELDTTVPLIHLGIDSLGWTEFVTSLGSLVPPSTVPTITEMYGMSLDELYEHVASLRPASAAVPDRDVGTPRGDLGRSLGRFGEIVGTPCGDLGRLAPAARGTDVESPYMERIPVVVIEHAEGAHVLGTNGTDYVDIACGSGALLFGHNPSFLKDRLESMLTNSSYALGFENQLVGTNARRLCQLLNVERVTFVTTGTEATTLAARLARLHRKRSRIVTFEGSYHGHFDGFLGRPSSDTTTAPSCIPASIGVPPSFVDESSLVVLAYDHEASLRYITEHADSLAAVFVEPVQARCDLKRDPRAFLHSLRELTRHHGIVLIFDEVTTGLRLGLGGAQARFGVQADLVAVGKALGAGSTPT